MGKVHGYCASSVLIPLSSYQDLEVFVNLLGFTPMEAILSATALGGEIMMHPDELGKVQPGYYADLILVDGNPLDDISVLTPTNGKLDMIMIVRIAFRCG
jgi:imidazolonepropionase-like amidohydrolase